MNTRFKVKGTAPAYAVVLGEHNRGDRGTRKRFVPQNPSKLAANIVAEPIFRYPSSRDQVMRIPSSLLAAALLTTLAGCTDGEEDHEPTPTLMISADVTDIMSGDTITLTIDVEHFTLSGEADGGHDDGQDGHENLELDFDPPLVAPSDPFAADVENHYEGPREGHVHVYLDDYMTNPLAMLTTSTGEVIVEADPGSHTLLCRLHGSDHKIIEPQITFDIDIAVQ